MVRDSLRIYNTLSGEKEKFKPLEAGFVGMYICGPTVYSDVHLGNCRTFTNFDVIYRYLLFCGYKVRYVRNITDVGHLEGDVDMGAEDKIAKKARLEKLEPMEVVQKYTRGFHEVMETLNNHAPSIEPRATGHIIDQINMVEEIIQNGYGYERNGSVYFDTEKFIEDGKPYGKLSGRKIKELIAESRDDLKNQGEKKNPTDFALWIKAEPQHLMKWASPWSTGFPGWHLECSAMSRKYLGEKFDIHGGGNDLKFPHHENEIAQNIGSCGLSPAKYWLHTNMLLLNGKKMSKSEGNSISPGELFSGDSDLISKAYSPMTVRFFMLQGHYRSTLDMTDEALSAAEKGLHRIYGVREAIDSLKPSNNSSEDDKIREMCESVYKEMDDDFNTPQALARFFELATRVYAAADGHQSLNISQNGIEELKNIYREFIENILGLEEEKDASSSEEELMELILELRSNARNNKDWETADLIRDKLNEAGIRVKDTMDGSKWSKI